MRNLPERIINRVSTHSRAEAAAYIKKSSKRLYQVSTHSRAEAAAGGKEKAERT